MPAPSRRRLLRLALGAAVTVALGAGLASIQPRRLLRRPRRADDASLPARASEPARVVVVGGGLAGIAAATGLAERGLQVTLLEQAPQLGGKIAGWSVDALGERFPIEHGFHGFFKHYYNLSAMMEAAGALSHLRPNTSYPLLFGDRPGEHFGTTTSVFPLNLMSVIAQSESLSFGDFVRPSLGLLEMMRHDPERTPARWDAVDFLTFARENDVPQAMIDTVLRPFADTSLNAMERMSAAYALGFFHFYFMGNPEGLGFDCAGRDLASAVVDPLVARMRGLGVDVRAGVRVARLDLKGGRVKAVILEGAGPAPEPVTLAAASVREGAWTEARDARGAPVWVTREAGAPRALSGVCTHMGCPVRPDPAGTGFLCPCHGGRYDARGQVSAGPPERPLEALIAVERDGQLTLQRPEGAAPEALPCDWAVVACDVPGLKAVLGATPDLDPGLAAQVGAMGTSGPYLVTRVWLDRPVRPDRDPFYTVSRFRYTDALALYCRFQEPFVSWAARTGGAVIELHAYAIAPEDLLPTHEIVAHLHEEMLTMLPELLGATVLHRETQLQDNFSRFAPGDGARVQTRTPLPNLLLAGDHVRTDVLAHLMEGAVTSGLLAANEILSALGLRELPVHMVDPRGPIV